MSRSRLAFVALIALLAAAVVWVASRPTSVAPTLARDPAAPASESRTPTAELDAPTSQPRARVTETEHATIADTRTSLAAERARRQPLVLYGFVRPAEGRAKLDANTNVTLTDRLGQLVGADVGSDGAYSFSSLQPGHYWLRARSHNGGNARAETDLDGSVTEKRLDVRLALPSQVLIKVIDKEGKPIRELSMLAIATLQPPGDWCDEIVGSFNNPFGVGHFWGNDSMSEPLDDTYFGRVLLDVEPPVFLSLVHYQRVIATQRIEPGVREVTFTIDRDSPLLATGGLRFRLVDAETHAVIPANGTMLVGVATRVIEPEGEVSRCDKLPPGYHEILATVPEYEQLRKRVLVEPGVEQDLGDLELNRERWITGTIVDDEGQPLALDVIYEIHDRTPGVAPATDVVMSAQSNADGSFRIGGLSRAAYIILPSAQEKVWAIWPIVIDTTAAPVENVRIQLVRGVPLVVRASDPDTWSTVRFTIIDSTGERVRSTRLWAPEPQPILLAPGNYSIEVRTNVKAEPRRIPITIGNTPVELALP